MTVYNLIRDYKMPLTILKRYGYVKSTVARDLKIYEEFLKRGGQNIADKKQLADDYKMSLRTVQRIIQTLSMRA